MITEKTAETKWCPLTRASGAGGGEAGTEWHSNRPSFADAHQSPFDLCIGAACMAWRWRREKETAAYLADVQAHMKATGENFNKATQKVWADKAGTYVNAEGYCGLAGRPE